MPRLFTLLATLLMGFALSAQAAERRVALVVGAGAYRHAPKLTNTINDAKSVSTALQRLGFEVETVLDPDRATFEGAVRRLGQRAQTADASLFYYAGHAVEVGGKNWVVPVSAELPDDRSLRFEAIELDAILEQTQSQARVSLVFLDSCRDNPFKITSTVASRAITRGLDRVEPTAGMFIAFATAPGNTAADGAGANSPFTTALLRHIETANLEIRQMMSRVRRDVRAETKGRQVPWDTSVLEGDFYFKDAPVTADVRRLTETPRPATDMQAEVDLTFWKSIENSNQSADYKAYLGKFPNGVFAELANIRIARLSTAPADRIPPTTAAPTTAAPTPPRLTTTPAATPSTLPPPATTHRPATASSPLAARLAVLLPKQPPESIETTARNYQSVKPQKALAVIPGTDAWWRNSDANSSESEIVERTLEGCQIGMRKPCAIAAVNDNVLPAPPGGETIRDMARVRYQGAFSVSQIPALRLSDRKKPEIAGYKTAREPKAMAIHAWGGAYAIAAAPNQRAAEENALAECNADKSRGRHACLLYAIGDTVVLPHRLTTSRPPAKTIEDALAFLIASSKSQAEHYRTLEGHKAMAFDIESRRSYRFYKIANRPHAQQISLEACQLRYNSPCVLLAADDELTAPDPFTATRSSMPRITYAGAFRPDMVPLFTDPKRKEFLEYEAMPEPKAMAIGVGNSRFRIASGTNMRDAEAKALAACNEPDTAYPCFIYAVNNRVVLPERRTEPRS